MFEMTSELRLLLPHDDTEVKKLAENAMPCYCIVLYHKAYRVCVCATKSCLGTFSAFVTLCPSLGSRCTH